jgi:hypothetical protein
MRPDGLAGGVCKYRKRGRKLGSWNFYSLFISHGPSFSTKLEGSRWKVVGFDYTVILFSISNGMDDKMRMENTLCSHVCPLEVHSLFLLNTFCMNLSVNIFFKFIK